MKLYELIRSALVLPLLLAFPLTASQVKAETAEEFEAKLQFQSGTIELGAGVAKLNLSKEFKYLAPEMAERVLVKAWGNPPEAAKGNLGMIFPNDNTPVVASWGAIITYEEDGYVDDKGAENINYDRMAEEIKRAMSAANPERIKQGYTAMDFVGWAERPHYDKQNHKLYWAKELKFSDSEENTLNYNIRILGRRGVLVLNAVAVKSQLQEISQKAEQLLPMIDFNPGHRYSDYIPGTDKVAEYGIAALVAGTVAAKAGLFKWLIALLLAAKKLVAAAVLFAVAFIKKLFGQKSAGGVNPPAQEPLKEGENHGSSVE